MEYNLILLAVNSDVCEVRGLIISNFHTLEHIPLDLPLDLIPLHLFPLNLIPLDLIL